MGAQGCLACRAPGEVREIRFQTCRDPQRGKAKHRHWQPAPPPTSQLSANGGSCPTQMSHQLTRRDFAIRTAGFGLAMGLAPAATLAEAEQASRSEPSPAIARPIFPCRSGTSSCAQAVPRL